MKAMNRFVIGYSLFGLVGALLALILDSAAFFSLTSYVPLYIAAAGYGLVGCKWVFVEVGQLKRLKAESVSVVVLVLLIVSLVLCLPSLKTSDRKSFHLAAASLKLGMPASAVKEIMRAYPVLDKEEGYLAFIFKASAQTEDRVIIDFNSGGTARKIEIVTD